MPDPLNLSILMSQLDEAGLVTDVQLMEDLRFPDLTEEARPAIEQILTAHPGRVAEDHQRAVTEVGNRDAIRADALNALAANRKDIADNEKWLTDNPAASPVLRSLAAQSTRQARQLNGVIRLLLERFDGTT